MARKARKTESKVIGDNTVAEPVVAQEKTDEEHVVSDEKLINEKTNYSPCGGILQSHRSEQGLSINEVAKQLRLSAKQIEALESDDFSSLPESTIVKGFIRNYAKLLKIPSTPLTQAYMEMVPDQEHYAFALDPGINRKISDNSVKSFTGYYALIILLLMGVGVWFFYQSYIQKPSPVASMPEVLERLPELALPMAERVNPASMPVEMPNQQEVAESEAIALSELEQTTNSTTNTEVEENGQQSEVAQNEETTKPSEVDASIESTNNTIAAEEVATTSDEVAPGKRRIHFTATQETWISVVNANGKEVYNKILYPGHRDTVDVWKPMEIVVGNAHGATLTVDGEAVDLAPYTRINVARVRLNR